MRIRKADLHVPSEVSVTPSRAIRVRGLDTCSFIDVDMESVFCDPLRAIGVRAAGIDILRTKYLAGTDMSNDHLLYFVLNGDAWAISRKWRRRIRKGDLLIAASGRALWVQLTGGHCRAAWFHLLDTEHWSALKQTSLSVQESLMHARIGTSLVALSEETQAGRTDSAVVARHYCELLSLYLGRELEDIAQPHERMMRHQLFRLWDQVNARLEQPWTVDSLAHHIHVSPGHLHRVTRAHQGMTPMEVVRKLRLDRAKHMLHHSNMTLDAIAAAIGYSSAYSFSNAFQKYTGSRPGAYRLQ